VKREVEVACGVDGDVSVVHGTGWGAGAVRGTSVDAGAACGAGAMVPHVAWRQSLEYQQQKRGRVEQWREP
jgi:hypothetical protein